MRYNAAADDPSVESIQRHIRAVWLHVDRIGNTSSRTCSAIDPIALYRGTSVSLDSNNYCYYYYYYSYWPPKKTNLKGSRVVCECKKTTTKLLTLVIEATRSQNKTTLWDSFFYYVVKLNLSHTRHACIVRIIINYTRNTINAPYLERENPHTVVIAEDEWWMW